MVAHARNTRSVGMTVSYRAYAKINLYLDVLDRRPDGYHDIETIFQTVGLSDKLMFSTIPREVSLKCNVPELDCLDSNLAYQAAMLIRERTGRKPGVHIEIEKHIPIAAGLAGGSADAAATLVALNAIWEIALSPSEIAELALELGSDVPYCTVGGTVLATGRGERITPLKPLRRKWFILVHPAIPVSASRVYNSPRLKRNTASRVNGLTAGFRQALNALENNDVTEAVFNRMEEAVFAEHPQLAGIKGRLLDQGCLCAAMSGSGPTVFGICTTKEDAVRIANMIEDYDTSVVSSVPRAVEQTE